MTYVWHTSSGTGFECHMVVVQLVGLLLTRITKPLSNDHKILGRGIGWPSLFSVLKMRSIQLPFQHQKQEIAQNMRPSELSALNELGLCCTNQQEHCMLTAPVSVNCLKLSWTNGWKCLWQGDSVNQYQPWSPLLSHALPPCSVWHCCTGMLWHKNYKAYTIHSFWRSW